MSIACLFFSRKVARRAVSFCWEASSERADSLELALPVEKIAGDDQQEQCGQQHAELGQYRPTADVLGVQAAQLVKCHRSGYRG